MQAGRPGTSVGGERAIFIMQPRGGRKEKEEQEEDRRNRLQAAGGLQLRV